MPWCSVLLHFIILHLVVGGTYLLYLICKWVLFLLCLNPACKTRVAVVGSLCDTGKEMLPTFCLKAVWKRKMGV